MPAFADQIDNSPVIVTALKMCEVQFCRLFRPQAAAQENREKSPISLALQSRLIGCRPVTQTNAEVLRPFDSPDPGGEIRGQQTRISALIRETPGGRKSAVDRVRRKLTRFQLDSIAGDNGFVERQSGLGALPGDDLFDGGGYPRCDSFEGRLLTKWSTLEGLMA